MLLSTLADYVVAMPSNATFVFEKLDQDVNALLTLHTGSGTPGRPTGNNGPLLRSAGFVREIGRQMFATFGATLLSTRAEMFVRTGTTRGS